MTTLQPTMLWEASDAQAALTRRFGFASAAETSSWLVTTLASNYGIAVQTVERLTISSYNLLAWLTTADGPLLAKCCAYPPAHPQLVKLAGLLVWLAQAGLPVSPPLATKAAERQILCDQRSLGVQRLIPGDLLNPAQPEQAHGAGVMLARLHDLLAAYPQASDFVLDTARPPLAAQLQAWLAKTGAALLDPAQVTGRDVLSQAAAQAELPALDRQLVHQDYRAANLLWHEGQLAAVLDFEELGWGYRVNDLAWATVHLGTRYHNWGPVAWTVQQTFLTGYQSVQPLTAAEQRWLPRLLLWHSLHLTATTTGSSTTGMGDDPLDRYTRQLTAEIE